MFTGRHRDAELIKREVLRERLQNTGEDHPVTLRCKSTLGITVLELGSLQEADSLLTEAYASQSDILGDEHPETITTMSRMANLYDYQGRMREAGELYEKTVQASLRTLGETHPRTEARTEDLARFERTRRSSEPASINNDPVSSDYVTKRLRGLSVDIKHVI